MQDDPLQQIGEHCEIDNEENIRTAEIKYEKPASPAKVPHSYKAWMPLKHLQLLSYKQRYHEKNTYNIISQVLVQAYVVLFLYLVQYSAQPFTIDSKPSMLMTLITQQTE